MSTEQWCDNCQVVRHDGLVLIEMTKALLTPEKGAKPGSNSPLNDIISYTSSALVRLYDIAYDAGEAYEVPIPIIDTSLVRQQLYNFGATWWKNTFYGIRDKLLVDIPFDRRVNVDDALNDMLNAGREMLKAANSDGIVIVPAPLPGGHEVYERTEPMKPEDDPTFVPEVIEEEVVEEPITEPEPEPVVESTEEPFSPFR